MNKSELVASVAEVAELTKKDAEKAVNAVFASVQKALVEDDKVQIIGSKNPVFKAGKALKDAVNQ